MNLTWDNLQQFVRIALYTGGSLWLGKEMADGEMFQAAIGGVMAIGAFVWFLVKNPVQKQ